MSPTSARGRESLLHDLIESARELIVGFDPEFQNELHQNIVLAGGGSQIRSVAEEVRSNLTEFGTCRVSAVEDPVYAGTNGRAKPGDGHA